MWKWTKCALVCAGWNVVACGSSADGSAGPSPSDRAAAEAELATVTQELGEATCATAPADITVADLSGVGVIPAGTTTYDHPTCRNAFIVDVGKIDGGLFVSGGFDSRWPDPFTCLLNWGYLSLWQKQASGYVKIGEASSLGTFGVYPMLGGECQAKGTLRIPATGAYRLIGSSGLLFGLQTEARVGGW